MTDNDEITPEIVADFLKEIEHFSIDVENQDELFEAALTYVGDLDEGPLGKLPDPRKDPDAYFEQEIDALEEARNWAYELMYRIGHPYAEAVYEKGVVEKALADINRYRRGVGERELDPEKAGWTDEDVVKEAGRLEDIGSIKKRMLNYG